MAEITAIRLVTENRQGLCCKPYLTFLIDISFPAGKFLSANGLEHLQGKGTMDLLYKLTIYEMDGRRRRKYDDRYHIRS